MMNTDIEDTCDANNLLVAFQKAKSGSSWKGSVQHYEINLLRNLYHTQEKMLNEDYTQKPFNEFVLCDRGKTRPIKAVDICDRVVMRSYCDNVLIPKLSKYLIYDNGASSKDKGITFARDRLSVHLQKYFREYGNEGYVLLLDFSKFFDNIVHENLLKCYADKMPDSNSLEFLASIIDSCKVDVSYMNDDEYSNCLHNLFDLVEYHNMNTPKKKEKFMKKSVGIGIQVSQISGLLYPTKIDNYCKIVKSLKYYGRYMDDIYVIHPSKEYLQSLLEDIKDIATELGLFVNPKKTQIVKLSKGFTFLKIKYNLTSTGKIIRRINSAGITRERRKIKKLAAKIERGELPLYCLEESYESYKGGVKRYDCYNILKNMDTLYYSIVDNLNRMLSKLDKEMEYV